MGGEWQKSDIEWDDDVIRGSALFREALSDMLSAEEATAANIAELVKKKTNFLMSVDNRCRVELSFWTSSIGDNARERVRAKILSCLPTTA